ncbi:MAG: metalloregulator ArsR/SmtB family transcription factor [Chitinivibrionales bacterium]|nr:metalloregulator ArsR/SmtB family transcription factor [Chitinivibrionales bacterium]MBD3357812.1 metalloregulator ArsR/SmtB family transcription factor [Chitinivibrionales bacterium]
MEHVLLVAKALADESRVRTVMALRGGELCACQIIALLRLAPSTVSKHMNILYHAGLVKKRKSKQWIHFRLPNTEECSAEVRACFRWLESTLASNPIIIEDEKRITTEIAAMKEQTSV